MRVTHLKILLSVYMQCLYLYVILIRCLIIIFVILAVLFYASLFSGLPLGTGVVRVTAVVRETEERVREEFIGVAV